MDEVALIALVRRAIDCHETTGCLEYVSDELQRRIRNDPVLQSVGTPQGIRMLLVNHACGGLGIDYRQETREEYQHRREFWFRVLVPIVGYPRPLFFELELTEDDPDYPSVAILNVHF